MRKQRKASRKKKEGGLFGKQWKKDLSTMWKSKGKKGKREKVFAL